MIVSKKRAVSKRDRGQYSTCLTPVQEIYIEVLKQNYEIIDCVTSRMNNSIIVEIKDEDWELKRHILTPQ